MNPKQKILQTMAEGLEHDGESAYNSIVTIVYLQHILETKDLPNRVIRVILAFPGAKIEQYPVVCKKIINTYLKQENLWKQ
jgi:hypothetical protein